MIKNLGIMLDLSRNSVLNTEHLEKFIDIMAVMGYNNLQLYLEDVYQVEGQPYFGYLRGRYSQSEIKHIDSYCSKKHIKLIPCIQTLAHLTALPRWTYYNGYFDSGDILLAGSEKVYELIDNMFASLRKSFTSNIINVGMDEAELIGRGEYLKYNKYKDQLDIFIEHLKKVEKIAKKYNFEIMFWSDMILKLSSLKENKQNLEDFKKYNLIYWDYYSLSEKHYEDNIIKHKNISDNVSFAGGLWSFIGFCPNNRFSIKSLDKAIKGCLNQNIENVFITLWHDNGGECSFFSLLPGMLCASCFAKNNFDMEDIKGKFNKMFGMDFDDFMLLDYPNFPCSTDDLTNCSKYFLYNDCFCGVTDKLVRQGFNDYYANLSKKFENLKVNPHYQYIFDYIHSLVDVLKFKTELGIKTRLAYLNKDKKALKLLIDNDYTSSIENLKIFYQKFKYVWYKENKPFGFEVQDIRIGGLIQRITHCKDMLCEYVNGKKEKIEELEEDILQFEYHNPDKQLLLNWDVSVSVNRL